MILIFSQLINFLCSTSMTDVLIPGMTGTRGTPPMKCSLLFSENKSTGIIKPNFIPGSVTNNRRRNPTAVEYHYFLNPRRNSISIISNVPKNSTFTGLQDNVWSKRRNEI